MDLLIVGDVYCANNAGNLGAERREIASNVSVIGFLFRFAAFPGIPVPGNGDQDGESEQYNQNRRDVSLPTGSRLCCRLWLFAWYVPASRAVLATQRERVQAAINHAP